MSENPRFDKGLEVMTKLFGRAPPDSVLSSDFMQVTVANLFGDISCKKSLVTLLTSCDLGLAYSMRQPKQQFGRVCWVNLSYGVCHAVPVTLVDWVFKATVFVVIILKE